MFVCWLILFVKMTVYLYDLISFILLLRVSVCPGLDCAWYKRAKLYIIRDVFFNVLL